MSNINNSISDINKNTINIECSDLCLQTYPCQHKVTINGIYKGVLFGDDIKKLYIDNNLEVPKHFKHY